MKIYTNSDIRAMEQSALRERGMTRSQMVRELGPAFSNEIQGAVEPHRQIVVFAGPELNGAYALETALNLFRAGRDVTVYLFNVGGNRLSAECTEARDRFTAEADSDVLCEVINSRFTLPGLLPSMAVVDGLFGIERIGALTGGYQELVRIINESGATVVALDVPSGLSGDSRNGLVNRNIIHADLTLTIGTPRLAFFMRENAELVGRWKVVPFDFGLDAHDSHRTRYAMVDPDDIHRLLHRRNPFASKADFGHAMLFAGSYGMMGAAVLAARGALRAGCGKLTVHSPHCGYLVMQTAVPSAMFDSDRGDVLINRIELNRKYDAVALGPGMGTADATIQALDDFLKLCDANSRPVILDADALNCIALRATMLTHLPVLSVLTPHEGEFDRLFGPHPTFEARLLKAIEIAETHKIIIVLKGRYTATVRPDGKVYFNPTGTPALATGGSGDVLTGVILGLMSQGMKPEVAAVAGVFIHGIAGQIAEATHGEYGVTAEDVAAAVGRAIHRIMSGNTQNL